MILNYGAITDYTNRSGVPGCPGGTSFVAGVWESDGAGGTQYRYTCQTSTPVPNVMPSVTALGPAIALPGTSVTPATNVTASERSGLYAILQRLPPSEMDEIVRRFAPRSDDCPQCAACPEKSTSPIVIGAIGAAIGYFLAKR